MTNCYKSKFQILRLYIPHLGALGSKFEVNHFNFHIIYEIFICCTR